MNFTYGIDVSYLEDFFREWMAIGNWLEPGLYLTSLVKGKVATNILRKKVMISMAVL